MRRAGGGAIQHAGGDQEVWGGSRVGVDKHLEYAALEDLARHYQTLITWVDQYLSCARKWRSSIAHYYT